MSCECMCERNVHGSKQIQDLENGFSQLASATSPQNKFDHIGNDHMLLYPIVRAWLGLVDKREHPRDLESLALLSCRRTDLTGRPSSTCSQRAVVMTQPCGETDGQGIGEIVLKLSNISGNGSTAGRSASRPPCSMSRCIHTYYVCACRPCSRYFGTSGILGACLLIPRCQGWPLKPINLP